MVDYTELTNALGEQQVVRVEKGHRPRYLHASNERLDAEVEFLGVDDGLIDPAIWVFPQWTLRADKRDQGAGLLGAKRGTEGGHPQIR